MDVTIPVNTTASEEGFPLLVRLDEAWFDFKQAKAGGADLRFASTTGASLACQIEESDPANGKAAIWVRIPTIKGNAQQDIKLFWGKADVVSESNGKAVFNESNGYVSVWHLGDQAQDEVGTVEAKDTGTNSWSGMVGKARHFERAKELTAARRSRPILSATVATPPNCG